MLIPPYFHLCSAIFILIGFQLLLIDAKSHGAGHFYRLTSKSLPYKVMQVDQSGDGDFKSVQAAIDSVPSNNRNWVCIYISAGTYREKVKIPYDKPYIILKGEGMRKTYIVWGDHETTAQSPTFTSLADNIIARSIGFVNSYNFPLNSNSNPRLPAVAAMISGDSNAFYRCGFAGVQDTLWDDQGRHYFKHCTIQGAVDFIFGSGQSIYEDCDIQVLEGGYITAQGRTNPNDSNGFVFKGCRVFGKGPAFLGRPWRGFARVIFYSSNFDDIIDPLGWNAWNCVGHEDQVTFVEDGNYGAGANITGRVKWINKLSAQYIQQLTSMSFIDDQNWIQKQPL
ncbi:hypothetical protein K2173_019111 [Erythroxylum novogranatense]|uniref:Pectinesterase n=1 Tax=Erythroxylum novogranatense TaxID=1862640 RepID=A0AAV8STN6_9ROSI|nr:hypothetical protein K2173_019111 [Erythroxylum novogranatense]